VMRSAARPSAAVETPRALSVISPSMIFAGERNR
jgi:hypothetical protein